MTVTGLWELLRGRHLLREINGVEDIRDLLEETTVAVDISLWVVEGQTRARMLAAQSIQARCNFFLMLSFWRAMHYLRLGCSPICVTDGDAPDLKCRKRSPTGILSRNSELVDKLFSALGCPTIRARGEAEDCCAALTRCGMATAVDTADSDIFPFGVSGTVYKSVDLGCNDSAWNLEVIDAHQVHESLGLDRQGLICLAVFSASDFSTGLNGIGAERGLQCARGLLQQCAGNSIKDSFMRIVHNGLPANVQRLAALEGCQTCRLCGHGNVKRSKHGVAGCAECGTSRALGGCGGCLPRTGPCPCEFHARHDEVQLARALRNQNTLPSTSAVEDIWQVYEGHSFDGFDVTWQRPSVQEVVDLLREWCLSPREATVKCLLPALLLWDLKHPNDPDAQFRPVGLIGECIVGLSRTEKRSISRRSLAVMEWGMIRGRKTDEELLEMCNDLPRARRSISKRMALRFCPELVVDYCLASLSKRAQSSSLPSRFKNGAHWTHESRSLCGSWGLAEIPGRIRSAVDGWDASWRAEAIHLITNHMKDSNYNQKCAEKIVSSFGYSLDDTFQFDIQSLLRKVRKQTTLGTAL